MRGIAGLHDQCPIPLRMIGEDLVGDDVARDQARQDSRAHHRAAWRRARIQLVATRAHDGHEGRGRILSTRLAEIAREEPHELFEIAHERGMPVHLDAEVLEDGDARRGGDAPRGRAHERFLDATDSTKVGDRYGGECRDDVLEARGMHAEPRGVDEVLLDEDGAHGRQQPRIASWPHLEMKVGELRRLRTPWIDDDERTGRVLRDVAQGEPGVRETVRLPRILAHEQGHFTVLEIAPYRRAEHEAVDPGLAGLLLRDGARPELRAERAQRRRAVEPAEMVSLPTAPVVEDGLAPVGVPHRREPRGDFGDRGVPIDLLEGTVSAATQRPEHALTASVLIVIQAERLLTGVALRGGVRLVASDLLETAAVVTAELDEDAAIALAEDARRRFPVGSALGGCLGRHRLLRGESIFWIPR